MVRDQNPNDNVFREMCCQNLIVSVSRDFIEFEHLKVAHLVRICISKTQSEKTKSECGTFNKEDSPSLLLTFGRMKKTDVAKETKLEV